MAAATNVLIMIHGIVPDPHPSSPFPTYEAFYTALVNVRRELANLIGDNRIYVQWGHELEDTPPEKVREDQKLTRAEFFINTRVSYDAVRTNPGPDNILLTGLFGRDYGIPGLRNLFLTLREEFVIYGVGDVIYYCSPEGEQNIRSVVYDQILTQLDKYEEETVVRLHIVGHSLGVTLAHDFLYGLFAPDHEPDFVNDKQGDKKAVKLFKKWRQKAQTNHLQLGTLISTASQLPLFMLRKQKLIAQFSAGELLDPTVINVDPAAATQWLIFYDIDDILGFPTKRLYQPTAAIKEIQVDTSDLPHLAHTGYWQNKTVVRETAVLIAHNCRLPVEPTDFPT